MTESIASPAGVSSLLAAARGTLKRSTHRAESHLTRKPSTLNTTGVFLGSQPQARDLFIVAGITGGLTSPYCATSQLPVQAQPVISIFNWLTIPFPNIAKKATHFHSSKVRIVKYTGTCLPALLDLGLALITPRSN